MYVITLTNNSFVHFEVRLRKENSFNDVKIDIRYITIPYIIRMCLHTCTHADKY